MFYFITVQKSFNPHLIKNNTALIKTLKSIIYVSNYTLKNTCFVVYSWEGPSGVDDPGLVQTLVAYQHIWQ